MVQSFAMLSRGGQDAAQLIASLRILFVDSQANTGGGFVAKLGSCPADKNNGPEAIHLVVFST